MFARATLALALFVGAPAPASAAVVESPHDGAVTKELEKLDGAWTVVASDWDDAKDKNRGKGLRCIVMREKVVIKSPAEDKPIGGFIIRIDPTKKPKTINVWSDESSFGKSVEDTLKEPPVLGIYVLDGDTLKICWVPLENRSRPTKFPCKRGRGDTLIVLTRDSP